MSTRAGLGWISRRIQGKPGRRPLSFRWWRGGGDTSIFIISEHTMIVSSKTTHFSFRKPFFYLYTAPAGPTAQH